MHDENINESLRQWLENPDKPLNAGMLEHFLKQFPFFQLPQGIAMAQGDLNLTPQQRAQIIERVAMSLSTAEAAQRIIDPASAPDANFYPFQKKESKPDTDSAISTFLSNYGTPADEAEISVLEKLIFNPVADYSQQLAREDCESAPTSESTGNDRTDRINRFILSHSEANGEKHKEEAEANKNELPGPDPEGLTAIPPTLRIPKRKTAEQPAENSTLSESLAKIYIKTGRYERAYEILSRLSLAVPEKNAYFADQMRFLRKLIKIQKLAAAQSDSSKTEK